MEDMPYKSARDYEESQALSAELEPLVRSYTVALVVPQCGINANQVAEITARLRKCAALLPKGGEVTLVVPGFRRDDPEYGIQMEVRNLGRIMKVHQVFVGMDPRDGGTAVTVRHYVEHKFECDEVWCCPELSHTRSSRARVNQVYQLGQQGARAARYKRIPPWVEAPAVSADTTKKQRKESKKWNR